MLGNIAEVIFGLLLLIWGADRFVQGAAALARNLGVAPLMIGLTIVAFATSAPEILVSAVAALRGETDLAVGNAIGSNIANIGLVLGTVALIKPIELRSATLRREMPALLAVTLLTIALFLDSALNRVDGFVLLTGLIIVVIWLVRLGLRSSSTDPLQADFDAEIPRDMKTGVAVMWLLVGIAALLFGAELLVSGAIAIARAVGVSEVVIGSTVHLKSDENERNITILGPWNSMPEEDILSNESDLAKKLLGRNPGEKIDIMGQIFTIVSIAPFDA